MKSDLKRLRKEKTFHEKSQKVSEVLGGFEPP